MALNRDERFREIDSILDHLNDIKGKLEKLITDDEPSNGDGSFDYIPAPTHQNGNGRYIRNPERF